MKNNVTVRIYNREYHLVTDETKDYTDKLVAELNRKAADLLKVNCMLSLQDAAALVSFESFYDMVKTRQNIENIRSQIKGYVDDAEKAREAEEKSEKELIALRERVKQLERELELRRLLDDNNSVKDIISQDFNKASENKKYPYNI